MGIELEEFSIEELAAPIENALSTGPFGSAISSKFFRDSGMPVIRGSNLSAETGVRLIDEGLVFVSSEKAKEFGRSIVRRGDLVFTCWGTINQVGLIDDRSKYSEYVISNKQMKFTPDSKKADGLFLYYVFSGPEKQSEILGSGIGSSVPGFNLGQLKGNRVQLPTLDVQKRIAKILSTLDDKIDLNRRMNRTLEAMAQAIFKSWFVDFEPVKAKAAAKAAGAAPAAIERAAMAAIAGRSIEEAIAQEGFFDDLTPSNRASLAQTAALFPLAFQASERGEIPDGWKVSSLKDMLGKSTREAVKTGPFGSNLHSSDYAESGVPLILVKHVMNGSIAVEGMPLVGQAKANSLPQYFLEENDIVVTRVGRVGDTAIVPKVQAGWMFSGQMLRVRLPVGRPILPHWLAAWYRTPQFRSEIEVHSVGSTRPSLNTKILAGMNFCLPNVSVQQEFQRMVEPLVEMASQNRLESATLAKLRDTLLPQLLSGKLVAPEVRSS